jgi:hypothetical protein
VKGRINTPFSNLEIDSKIEYSPNSTGGYLWSAFGFLVQAKLAHHTLNLASKFLMLAEQCLLPMTL